MPRVRKGAENTDNIKKTATSITKKATSKKSSTTDKKKSATTPSKKTVSNKKAVVKKSTVSKKISKTSVTKKAKTTSQKSRITSKKSVVSKKDKENDFINVLEYYDLPYRYNETIVKILAQTPKILFVYWDISDNDRLKLINRYGEYFFNDTYPVLIVYNKTLNYFQEVEINDFANSWYVSIPDSRSEYVVELGRRFKEYAVRNPNMLHKEDVNKRLSIAFSNELIMPNDHVLINEVAPKVLYRNVKTNKEFFKSVVGILQNKKYELFNFYKDMYNVEDFSELLNLNNPSSGGNPTSTFK